MKNGGLHCRLASCQGRSQGIESCQVVNQSLCRACLWLHHHTEPDKLLKGASVVHLEFKLFIAQVEKLLENEHLEKDQRVNPLAPCIAPALVLIALVKQWSE